MKKRNTTLDILKAMRKKSRDEEIMLYGKPLPKLNIRQSKKKYKRNKKVKLDE